MQFSILIAVICFGVAIAAPPQPSEPAPAPAPVQEEPVPPGPEEPVQPYPAPQIDWGKCPQLKPTEADKEQKRIVIQKCLEQNPPPSAEAITNPKDIDTHREVVTTCALKKEGWFNENGTYKFDKAKSEIQSKNLDKEVEKNISKRHKECEEEAAKRYPKGYIEQVQLYQACMDYHIAEICEIELIAPPDFPVEMYLDDEVPSEELLRQLLPEEEELSEEKSQNEEPVENQESTDNQAGSKTDADKEVKENKESQAA